MMKVNLMRSLLAFALAGCVASVCSAQPTSAPTSAPAPAASPEIGKHIEKVLAKDAGGQEEWCFGVVADPHIFLYGWNDGALKKCLSGWAAAKASVPSVLNPWV